MSSCRRGTAEKLRDQVKEAFSLPDAPQVLGPTLNFVGGPTFEIEESIMSVSWERVKNRRVLWNTFLVVVSKFQ